MTHHEPFESESESEAEASFERLLLRSASADRPPEGATREAWAKFASASAGIALIAAPTPGLGGMLHAVRRASLKWFAVGALGGSALTAAWMGSRNAPASAQIAPSSLSTKPAASIVASLHASSAEPASAQPTSPKTTLQVDTSPIQHHSSALKPPALKQTHARPTTAARPSNASESTASSLAAEVAALDAVQRAFAMHDFSRAVRLVDEYQREFPRGQLAPDADALAIEALEAEGNRAELRLRAERFLSRYPKDPHRARIATLLEP